MDIQKLLSLKDKLFSRSNLNIYNALSVLGGYAVAKFIIKTLCFIKKYFFLFNQDLKAKYGDGWVVITGGSDGIGKALAEEFILRGHKVLITGRNEEKLKDVISQFEKMKNYQKAEYLVYDMDVSYTDDKISELKEKFSPYEDISILISNAGGGMNGSFTIDEVADDTIRNIININITGLTIMTKLIIQKMKNRKKSLIVGCGSGQHLLTSAYKSVYAASKCYLDGLLSSIRQENDNIDYTYLEICSIETKLNINNKQLPLTLNDPKIFVIGAINQMGKYNYASGYYKHGFQILLLRNDFIRNIMRRKIKKILDNSRQLNKN